MISIDTNVLIRVLVDDTSQPDQVRMARDRVRRAGTVFVAQVVQVETVWVLETAYRLKRKTVAAILDHLARNTSFVLEQEDRYMEALALYQKGRADFADYLILAAGRDRNCSVLTFDRRFGRTPGVTLISAPAEKR